MCGIAGVLGKSENKKQKKTNVVPLVKSMLSCMVHRGPDGAGIAADDEVIINTNSIASLAAYKIRASSSVVGHNRLAIVGGTTCGSQPFVSCDKRLVLEHNGEIYNYKLLRKKLENCHNFKTLTDSEVIVHLLEDNLKTIEEQSEEKERERREKKTSEKEENSKAKILELEATASEEAGAILLKAIQKTIAELDGVYALVIRDTKTGYTALVRDRLGVRQLYYAQTDKFLAFASELKALWKIGINEQIERVMPCTAVMISPGCEKIETHAVASIMSDIVLVAADDNRRWKERRKKKKVGGGRRSNDNNNNYWKPRYYRTMRKSLREYRLALLKSMQKRTQDFERIGIIFSGGIDSVMIAHLAKQMVPNIICYTGGIKGSSDIEYARQIAKELDLDLRVNEMTRQDIEELVPEIITVIEDNNAGQVEVALPVYAAVELAHKDGIRVMLSGQAADELFGGYPWYAKVVEREGYDKLREHMTEDLFLLYKETLEREDKITMAHSVELRVPFLDPEVVNVAMRINPCFNVKGGDDIFGKHVHRELAVAMGIPRNIAYRVKEAAQHGSGTHGALDAIARRSGFASSDVPDSYLEELRGRERIGSSQRYGYLFGNKRSWVAEPHVQMYLDKMARTVLPNFDTLVRSSVSSSSMTPLALVKEKAGSRNSAKFP
ncbi:asparagine synthase, glutamine-hydrolyzing [Candidatus Nitrososphaera evergladensis SR1]|uniref:Putative asparagine synthetase [glutamine-hydrolyzing] n=1 Tax=Candidatus Nitrososphaera evergladensis SR1 TaxID=1459636 RepID=A0A075MXY8_9ARCH|nr:asparagine synthase (glutamine-hydrolyzing) [Candidatus Nitrososphaera evergladensis]AIF85502.1 asparagine synthase, glutamine-hydrolyzing [Candidatus Nitrososphaera evergladensis SR1]